MCIHLAYRAQHQCCISGSYQGTCTHFGPGVLSPLDGWLGAVAMLLTWLFSHHGVYTCFSGCVLSHHWAFGQVLWSFLKRLRHLEAQNEFNLFFQVNLSISFSANFGLSISTLWGQGKFHYPLCGPSVPRSQTDMTLWCFHGTECSHMCVTCSSLPVASVVFPCFCFPRICRYVQR